ncbi:hypothetical protein GCM10007036_43080 [Alsobacter metallidurans]|uniref:Phasin domain-containing protein n=1 Tax=Alsobacter metallidurans TaxID=340221 RepID=A0A917MJH5_9HYPH|nr:hypothetical protein [Alsobacter metallidurans]GGH31697.1 hypothetical protein GCM10007036_43080 [Alsobacter metallidurans]
MTSSSHPKTATIPLQQPFGTVEDVSRALQGQMAAVAAIPRAIMEAQLTIGSELFIFLARRLKAQAELWHELSQSREFLGAVQAQRRFADKAASDYSAEASEMATMLSREVGVVSNAASEAVAAATASGKIAA